MRRVLLWALLLGLGTVPATGTPYWIAWEGEGDTAGMPEEFGWTRNWGNWQGQYQGPGAYRTLEDGILTYDSLYDAGVYDFAYMRRLGQTDPAPGGLFVAEWSVKVDQVEGWSYDPGVVVASDTARIVGLGFSADHVESGFEEGVYIPIEAGVFHAYRLVSADMLSYELYIDGEPAHVGSFWEGAYPSYVGWGDSVQGAASRHKWDYFRFGVIPEPSSILLLGALAVCRRAGRGAGIPARQRRSASAPAGSANGVTVVPQMRSLL